MAQGAERGGRRPGTLWEPMDVTRDLQSFLAAVGLPAREADVCESQERHGGRKTSGWYMSFLNEFVKPGWPAETQAVSKQVFFWWSIADWGASHGHPQATG